MSGAVPRSPSNHRVTRGRIRMQFVERLEQGSAAAQLVHKFEKRGYRAEVRVDRSGTAAQFEVWRTAVAIAPPIAPEKMLKRGPALLQAAIEAIDSVSSSVVPAAERFVLVDRRAMAKLRLATVNLTGQR